MVEKRIIMGMERGGSKMTDAEKGPDGLETVLVKAATHRHSDLLLLGFVSSTFTLLLVISVIG
jgi:hypothetical protein